MGCGCAHWCRGGICSHFTPLPRDRSALGRRAAPTTWWGARQGCRAWGWGGGGVGLSTPLLYPPPARINIYGWAEWGGLQGKAKLEGWGGGGEKSWGALGGGMAPARDVPSEGTALAPSAQHPGPVHGQTPPSCGPRCRQTLCPVFQSRLPIFCRIPIK